MKKIPKRIPTKLDINKSVIGETIELTMERLMEGDGIEAIEDRDLVYNDGETGVVNPITNIRSDKMELLLEEKIGEYEFKHRKTPKIKIENDSDKEPTEGGDQAA